jgi:signal-transduction protein with cAMP-binding, CBS, and nucleotidyltransferase domain
MWIDDFRDAPTVSSTFGNLVWYASHRHDVPLPSPAQDLYIYDGVAAGEAGVPDLAEIRGRLRVSALLDQLDDDALDLLAAGARAHRFAEGEVILQVGRELGGLHVLWSGSAQMSIEVEGMSITVADLAPGDVFGLVGQSDQWPNPPQTLAISDCEIVVVDSSAAQTVTSHNPSLAAALNQVMDARRRRIDRVVEGVSRRTSVEGSVDESSTPTDGGG